MMVQESGSAGSEDGDEDAHNHNIYFLNILVLYCCENL